MPAISTYSLAPVKGQLDRQDLLHLLRRCLFGVAHKELDLFTGKNIDQCMDVLLKPSPTPKMLAQEDPDLKDPLVPIGADWINAPYENDVIDKNRTIYLKSWWVGQIINRDHSLTEKMTLFWHNHFVTETEVVKDSRYSYRYATMLRANALGNFKNLIKEGTTNIAMLVYLNGNSNEKSAPNENYSRELMELFTLGKGFGVNYTEDDVKAGARVLSGWKDNKETIKVSFVPELHDTGDKQFSPFFDNTVIKGKSGAAGAEETNELIDMIFRKKETARFVCRNLYRWFINGHIDDRAETEVVNALADIFIENHFEITPVLRTLLSSEHFFDKVFRGCIVKSPVDFMIGAALEFDLNFPKQASENHLCWIHYNFNLGGLSMFVGDPPSVAGWPAFYQAPKYHQWWINSYTLGFRMKIIDSLTSPEGMNCNGPKIKLSFIKFIKQFKNPGDLNELVDDSVQFLCAIKIKQASKDKLKAILLSGQQNEGYWTKEWNKYIANPRDTKAESVLESRLKLFYTKIINMPEYQMM